MRARYALPLIMLLIAVTGIAQTAASKRSAQAGDASVVGVWRMQEDGLPFVTLTLTDEGGTLSGAILFYLHMRQPGGQVTSTPGIPEPLLNPRFDGKSVIFQVSHRRAHPPSSLSTPPVHFRMDVTDANHASLVNESEHGSSATRSAATLSRSDY